MASSPKDRKTVPSCGSRHARPRLSSLSLPMRPRSSLLPELGACRAGPPKAGWSGWSRPAPPADLGLPGRQGLTSLGGLLYKDYITKSKEVEMFKEFKEFALRGSVIDMAVGIIIGAAFGAVVSSL